MVTLSNADANGTLSVSPVGTLLYNGSNISTAQSISSIITWSNLSSVVTLSNIISSSGSIPSTFVSFHPDSIPPQAVSNLSGYLTSYTSSNVATNSISLSNSVLFVTPMTNTLNVIAEGGINVASISLNSRPFSYSDVQGKIPTLAYAASSIPLYAMQQGAWQSLAESNAVYTLCNVAIGQASIDSSQYSLSNPNIFRRRQ